MPRPLASLAVALLLLAGCGSAPQAPGEVDSPSAGLELPAGDLFIDATEGSGLSFVHFNGMTGEFLYPEVMAPGLGLFDYDNDGDLDVFVVQGRMLGG